jgi:hypothetical protein
MVMAYNTSPLSGLASAFQTGMGIGSAFRQRKDENVEREAVGKLLSGDDSGWSDWGKVNPQAAMNAWNRQQSLDQKSLEKQFNTTNQIKHINDLIERGKTQDEAIKLAYGLDAYTKEKQKQQAQAEIKAEQTAKASAGRLNRISGLLGEVEQNKDKLTPYSPVSSAFGAATFGNYGMTDKEREVRGGLLREIAAIKQELIARAKEQGQSGINTAREIEQATAGINSGDYATLIGALKALQKYEQTVTGLENGMSVTPEQGQEVISFEDWMKQGS